MDEHRLATALAVRLEHVDGLDRVAVASLAVRRAHRHSRVHHHVGEELRVAGAKVKDTYCNTSPYYLAVEI